VYVGDNWWTSYDIWEFSVEAWTDLGGTWYDAGPVDLGPETLQGSSFFPLPCGYSDTVVGQNGGNGESGSYSFYQEDNY
jgi:hypothetical protein